MDEFKSIIVKRGKYDWELEVINPTQFELIGKGAQGAVFKLSEERCVKIYLKETYYISERDALKAAEDSQIVPKMYEAGSNYIVMEYIKGQSLEEYLNLYGFFPEPIVRQILYVFQEMKRVGFRRIDARLRHMFLTDEGVIKVIDHVKALSSGLPYPYKFLKGLSKRNLLDSFLEQVKKIDSKQYSEWKNVISKL
jgi:RIO-like serine/threonine protein kinase